MATLEENRQQALDWANAQRTEWGLSKLDELPLGMPSNRLECVLGRALNGSGKVASFAADGYMDTIKTPLTSLRFNPYNRIKMPHAVAAFECDFERGFYPDLIEPSGFSRRFREGYWGMPTAEDSPAADEFNLVGLA